MLSALPYAVGREGAALIARHEEVVRETAGIFDYPEGYLGEVRRDWRR
jgi:hypothetical protein